MKKLSAAKYRKLFKLRAEGKLEAMECTKNLFKLLKQYYFPGMTILDIPCGIGHYYRKLKELGDIKYTGMDLDPESIKMAKNVWKKDKNTTFIKSNVNKLGFKKDSIDVVICYNLFMHLRGYKMALKELYRVTKKYLIIRSLFDKKTSRYRYAVDDDYLPIYPQGYYYYSTFAKSEVVKYLRGLGNCKYKFTNDNLPIPQKSLKQQAKLLKVDESEFASTGKAKKQDWKNLKLNYEVLFIEKLDK